MKNAIRAADESFASAGGPNSSVYKSRPESMLISQPFSTANPDPIYSNPEPADEKVLAEEIGHEDEPTDLNIEVAVQASLESKRQVLSKQSKPGVTGGSGELLEDLTRSGGMNHTASTNTEPDEGSSQKRVDTG